MTARRAAALLTTAATLAGGLALTAAPAHADTFYEEQTRSVTEASSGQTYSLKFGAGQYAKVRCTGSIWAGVLFTFDNGPDGWADPAPNHFPQPGYKGGRSFSVIGQYRYLNGTPASSYFHVGSDAMVPAPNTWSTTYLTLRTNDDRPGNGSGSFTCTTERWRP